MSEPAGAERDGQGAGYMRLPMPAVAAALLVLIALLLAFGLWANRNLRAQGAPAAAGTPEPATVAVAAAPTTGLVATPTPFVAPTATAQATATPVPLVATATVALSPTAAPADTPLPTVEPTLAAEVGQAYENFWRVRSQALLELDTTHLSEVMDGDYLETVSSRIDELRAEGKAIKTHVVLDYTVVEATQDVATVIDDFEDDSVYVKVGTEQAISEPTAEQVSILFKLRNFSGVWKVIDSVRPE